MQRVKLLLITFLINVSVFSQQNFADTGAKIDKIFARFNNGTPGATLAISRNGAIIFSKAWGMADLEHNISNTDQTIFEAGSVSKQFTAAAILLLEQQGKLSLQDDIRKYFPELPQYSRTITLQQMMTHTSGFRDWGAMAAVAGWPRGSRMHTHQHALQIIVAQKELNHLPGDEFLYSNTNYNLFAMLVERVSGLSLADFTAKYLFQPLGMTNTQWRDDYTRIVKDRAIGYSRSGNEFKMNMPFENVYGQGGLLTTVSDLLTWTAKVFRGEVAGKDFLQKQLQQGVLTNSTTISYAAGLFVASHRGWKEISHNGATAAYRASLVYYPEADLSIALLSNSAELPPTAVSRQVANLFLNPKATAPNAVQATAFTVAPQQLQQYNGAYKSIRSGEGVLLKEMGGKLTSSSGGFLQPTAVNTFSYQGQTILFTGAEKKQQLHFISFGDTSVFVSVDTASLTEKNRTEYAGSYHSEEADATYSIEVKEGGLFLIHLPDQRLLLTPKYKDGFSVATGLTVYFKRNKKNEISEMRISEGRARNVRFEKLPAPTGTARIK